MTEHQIVLLLISMAAAFVLGYLSRSFMNDLSLGFILGLGVGVALKIALNMCRWLFRRRS